MMAETEKTRATEGKRLVVFGVSNLLGNIWDCALELGLKPSRVVLNVPEVIRPRTKSVYDRVLRFEDPPQVIELKDFTPGEDEVYFLGTSAPGRDELYEHIHSRFGITCCILVHPMAYVSPHARISSGVYIGAHTSIGPGARIGENVVISSTGHVGHDTTIEPYTRIFNGSNVAGHVQVGRNVTIGMGAIITEELVIGANAYIAAGAVVLEDVPPRTLVAGVPAKVKRTL